MLVGFVKAAPRVSVEEAAESLIANLSSSLSAALVAVCQNFSSEAQTRTEPALFLIYCASQVNKPLKQRTNLAKVRNAKLAPTSVWRAQVFA